MLKSIPNVQTLVELALAEDLYHGDMTTDALSLAPKKVKAGIVLEEDGVIAGLELVELIFQKLQADVVIKCNAQEGKKEKTGKVILELQGEAAGILMAERTILNFLARLSGMATTCSEAVAMLDGYRCRLLDTRKTTPGWRYLDKYAARLGGVTNHRFALSDGILIKDNHLKFFPSLSKAVKEARKNVGPLCKIAVEVENEMQVKEALKCQADHLLLDNMSPQQVRKMVNLINHKAQTEASGGINLENILDYAATGVDFISLGILTTSVQFLKMKMEI